MINRSTLAVSSVDNHLTASSWNKFIRFLYNKTTACFPIHIGLRLHSFIQATTIYTVALVSFRVSSGHSSRCFTKGRWIWMKNVLSSIRIGTMRAGLKFLACMGISFVYHPYVQTFITTTACHAKHLFSIKDTL